MSAFLARHPGAHAPGRSRAPDRTGSPWFALPALMLWYGGLAWLRPLALPDEGRYVGVAWEMLHSGHWLVPTLDGLPYFHKPPLFYWITAAAMQCFGPSVLAARAAPWLGAVATTVALFVFMRRWAGAAPAAAATGVLATLPLFFGGAQYANLDMPVAACIALAVLCAAHAQLQREAGERWRAALAGAFACAALGVLAKGLIGLAIPGLVLIAWALATRRAGAIVRLAAWWPGWLLLLAIAAPWFVAMQLRFPGFAHYFFVVQQVDRFTGVGFNNGQPAWFYPAVLLVGSLPWWPWLLRRRARATAPSADVRALMLAWLGVVVVFFSLPHSKLVGYVLPALAPLAALIGDAAGAAPARWRHATLAAAAAVCIGGSVAAHFAQPKSLAQVAGFIRQAQDADEPVVFLGNYYFDVPFYARLGAPVFVVDAWSAADVARDSWRRELVDAQGFAPQGSAPHRLLQPLELDALLCRSGGAWLIGPWPAAADAPEWLRTRAPERRSGSAALWHVGPADDTLRRSMNCEWPRALARITAAAPPRP